MASSILFCCPDFSLYAKCFGKVRASGEMIMPQTTNDISNDLYAMRTKEIIYAIRRLMQAGEHYTKKLNKIYNVSAAPD